MDNELIMKTKFAKKEDFYNGTCRRAWWIVDAEGKTLGRVATRIAHALSCLLYTSDAADEL